MNESEFDELIRGMRGAVGTAVASGLSFEALMIEAYDAFSTFAEQGASTEDQRQAALEAAVFLLAALLTEN